MAVYNEILVGRFNRFLQKNFQMKGGPPSASLATEITPVFPLEDFGVENRFSAGWERFGAGFIVGAVIGNNTGFLIQNPAPSNVLAVLEMLGLTAISVTDQFLVSAGGIQTQLAQVANAVRLDGRGRSNSSAVTVSGGTAVTFPGNITFDRSGGNVGVQNERILTVNQEIPLLPGTSVGIQTNELNVTVQLSVRWRERFLEESERA